MSSEHLASAQVELKGDLGASWNILDGASANYTDLGIARRFGGSSAAYSLRDIGAMNGPVVKVRRDMDDPDADTNDPEVDFSASQVASGALEDWVNGKLETTLPADVDTAAAAYSLRKVTTTKTIYNQSSFPDSDVAPLIKNMAFNSFVGNVDGYQGKDNLIKLTMDAVDEVARTPQVAVQGGSYGSSRTGTVTFEYYIESDSPLVGGYWIVGNESKQYSPEGVEIIGGAWTTAVLEFVDKTGSIDGQFYGSNSRLLSIRNASSGGQPIKINRNDTNPFIHFSSFLITATDFAPVRIRRIDNTEVNVGFDSDGKISANSLVGNTAEEGGEISETSETTLGNFLQGEANVRAMFNNSEYFGVKETNWWSLQTNEIQLGSDPFTITCDFVCTDSFGNNTSRIAQSYDGLDFFQFTNSTQFTYRINGQSNQSIAFSPALQLGRKYSFEVSRDSSDHVTLKIDGVTMGTNTVDSQNSGDCHIGRIGTFRLLGAVNNYNFNNGEHIIAGDGTEASNWADTGSVGGKSPTKIGSSHTLFTGQGMDSFVHTWYDQSPSGNDVTQTTSANQPKIAENGALLADGIDFDGSASYLDATSALGATATIGAFIVHKPDDSDANQYLIDNRDGNSDGMRIMQRSDGDGNYRFSMDSTDVNSASGTVNTREVLLTAIQSSTAAKLFKNAQEQATAADDAISVTAAFRIGANRVSTGTYFNGSMKEIILFTSDQTDNRFKLQSNINNYYGLYDDDNEQQSVRFSTAGGTADTSEALRDKFGFTGSGGAGGATGFFGIRLKYKVLNTKTIHISFNSTKASSSSSFGVGLYRDSVGGTLSQSAVTPIVEGFNSFTLTSNNDTAEYISFSENDEVAFTVSDFRVSTIERNGFVHTWYDQSSNENDATQGTAANQPAIVTNGGLESGLSFDGTNDFLQTSTQVLTGTETGSNGIYAVVNVTSGDAGYVAGSASDNTGGGDAVGQSIYASSATSKFILTNGLDADQSNRDNIPITVGSFVLISACYNNNDANTLQKNSSTTSYADGSLAYDFNAGTKFTIGHRERSAGVNAATNLNGTIKEVIAFDIDTTSDRSEIQADIQNHYNL